MLANLFRILQLVTAIDALPHKVNNSHSLVVFFFLLVFFTNFIKRACLSN